ncbi:MAG: DUF2163 domain-containing protein [Pseudomonadota bacterium]
MSVVLPADAQALYDQGWAGEAYLVRFNLPGRTVGYVNGPRPVTYNALTYLPNRYLQPIEGISSLGSAITQRELQFSNVPTENADDSIAAIEGYAYQNAPVQITSLAIDPQTGEIAGAVETASFEISSVVFGDEPIADDGTRALSMSITLDAPGRAIREQTAATTGQQEQQFDNDPTDTSSQFLGTVGEWAIEWGRV